jgi:hypothetical protein
MNKDDLKKFVQENPKLVTMKESTNYPGLFVLKYSRTVFFKGLWNDFLEECRGTVIDADFNVISRPFTKIYNFRVEDKSPVLDDATVVTAYRKVNGFMAALTWHNNDILVSTTGSLDSDFVGYAKEMMLKHACWEDWQMAISGARGATLMFECVHPIDPHICPEDAGMYLLGHRDNEWDSKIHAFGDYLAKFLKSYALDTLKCYSVDYEVLTVGELMTKSKTAKHEGFVFYTEDGQSAKIKTKYYLIQKALARKKDIMSLNKEWLDEEFYPMVDHLNSIKDQFNALDEQARLEYMRNYLESH